MLVERRKTTYDVVDWIKEGEKLCIEALDIVSAMWGLFLEYDTREKFVEDARQDDLKITTVKVEMKKLPIK